MTGEPRAVRVLGDLHPCRRAHVVFNSRSLGAESVGDGMRANPDLPGPDLRALGDR